MLNGKRVVAVIPARGGSKRFPRKNLADLAGRPLIAWTIDAARGSRFIDATIVSTDDPEIAAVSQHWGAEVPFIRPAQLADDRAKTRAVLVHAVEALRSQQREFDWLILLQPTSPLRQAVHIDEALAMMTEKSADAIISLCQTEHPPLWSNTLPEDCSMRGFIPGTLKDRSGQELPTYYRLNGAIYVLRIERLLREETLLWEEHCFAYVMPTHFSVDIDTEFDLMFARTIVVNGGLHQKSEMKGRTSDGISELSEASG